MDVMDGDERGFVDGTTREITNTREYEGAYVWDGVTNLLNKEGLDPVHLGGFIIHESVHHWDWQSCRPAGGVEAEERAIERMAVFYENHGRPELAAHYRSTIGTHGVGYEPALYSNPACAQTQT